MDMEVMRQGLAVALLGLAGVFIVLILFYFSVKLMLLVFKNKK
ncbi:oxaloacetate decarboxylase [Anaerosphaera multitolerans]|uniref:Oxaloacetate decarboxylase n=1 Tax=Anaerosphaera multitolerans TaxID=2487351 RepID=A0A437S6A2_9FIRM|nr:oxaloacetate decarboxylase [Anaerosphaera multitolerans]RVU54518.1 oxaloacetate decarboxylase [Anaerosphaera multitolerans]